ncbi:hypothetical protein [Enterovibrio norvegicus]|uniref:hypothetical protein n=1 Tax=Enterovibrio norvegicus TaxID=188144 RepID=UPI00352F3183
MELKESGKRGTIMQNPTLGKSIAGLGFVLLCFGALLSIETHLTKEDFVINPLSVPFKTLLGSIFPNGMPSEGIASALFFSGGLVLLIALCVVLRQAKRTHERQ